MTAKTFPSAPSFNTWEASLCAEINKINIPWAIEEVLHARYNPQNEKCEKFFTEQVVLHVFTRAEKLQHEGSLTISMNESHQLSVTKNTKITSNLSTASPPCKELLCSLPSNSSAAIDFQPLSYSSPKDLSPLEEDSITPETTDTTIFSKDMITKKLLQLQNIISTALQNSSSSPKNLSDLVIGILNTPRASMFSSNQVDPEPYEWTFESHLALTPPSPEELNLQHIHKLTVVAKRILTKKMPTITFSLLFKTFLGEALLRQTMLPLPSKNFYSPIGSPPVNLTILHPFQQRAQLINTDCQHNLAPTEPGASKSTIVMGIRSALRELNFQQQIKFS